MGRFIVLHIPHIVPVLVAFAFLGRLAIAVADQPPVHLDESAVDEWRSARAERPRARRVRRSTSRIGLIALVPLLAATASGLVLYTFALERRAALGARSAGPLGHLGARARARRLEALDGGPERLARGTRPPAGADRGRVTPAGRARPAAARDGCAGCSPRRPTARSRRTSIWSRASGGWRSSACTCSAISAARSTPRYATAATSSSTASSRGIGAADDAVLRGDADRVRDVARAELEQDLTPLRLDRRLALDQAVAPSRSAVRPFAAAQSTSSSLGVSTEWALWTRCTSPRSCVSPPRCDASETGILHLEQVRRVAVRGHALLVDPASTRAVRPVGPNPAPGMMGAPLVVHERLHLSRRYERDRLARHGNRRRGSMKVSAGSPPRVTLAT